MNFLAGICIVLEMKIWSHIAPFLSMLETYKKFIPTAKLFCIGQTSILNMHFIHS
jgi:hypothetical protein